MFSQRWPWRGLSSECGTLSSGRRVFCLLVCVLTILFDPEGGSLHFPVTSINFYQTARFYIPKDRSLHDLAIWMNFLPSFLSFFLSFLLRDTFHENYRICVGSLRPVALSIQGSILFSSRKQAIGRRSAIDVISRPFRERREPLPQYLLEAFVCGCCWVCENKRIPDFS
jgi:hypothetical protein